MHPLPLMRCGRSASRAISCAVPQKAPSFLKHVHLPLSLSLSLIMFHVFPPLDGFSPPPPDTSVDEAAQTAVGGRSADEVARTTASVADVERATQEVKGAGRGRTGGRGRGVRSGLASGGQAGGEEQTRLWRRVVRSGGRRQQRL